MLLYAYYIYVVRIIIKITIIIHVGKRVRMSSIYAQLACVVIEF